MAVLTPLTFYNNNDNPKSGRADATAHSDLSRYRLQHLPRGQPMSAGGFGPMNMTQATHARVSDDGLHHLPRGRLELLHGRGKSRRCRAVRPITPQGSRSRRTIAACATPRPTGAPPCCLRATCRTRPIRLQCLPHGSARQLHDARGESRCCTPASPASARQCHGNGSQLIFYNNDTTTEGQRAHAGAHPVSIAGPTVPLPCPVTTYAAGGFGPMNMTQATHSFVVDHLCHLPRGRALVLYGRRKPGTAGAACGSHARSAGGAERLQPVPHHGQLEQHYHARGPHAEPGQ